MKLEEKKLELAERSVNRDMFELHEADARVRHYKLGFDAGVSAYKEMLEGVGEVDVTEIKNKVWEISCLEISEISENNLTTDMSICSSVVYNTLQFFMPVLAKLQQQAEKIEQLTKQCRDLRITNQDWQNGAELNEFYIRQGERIAELKSRLKEAEKIIENLTGHAEASIQFPHKDKTDLVVAAYTARQYMEKVK
jgi:hypothetical protein